MNYRHIYNALMHRSVNRIISEYTERHHIIPKSLGGTDDSSNLAVLTLREHFIAHRLLARIYKGTPHYRAMIFAARKMATCHNNRLRITSRVFEQIKTASAKEHAALTSQRMKGVPKTADHRRKISEAHMGKSREVFSPEWRTKLSIASQQRHIRNATFVWAITSPTGEVYRAYSLTQLCRELFGEEFVVSASSNIRHKPYKGYTVVKEQIKQL